VFVSVQPRNSTHSILINRDHISSVRWSWLGADKETTFVVKIMGEDNVREYTFGHVTEGELMEKVHALTGTDLEAVDVDAQQ
jgi:hypothetical protein